MARPRKMKQPQENKVYGVWNMEKFSAASPRSKSWWYDNINSFPEVKDFSNWEDKEDHEPWAFDAAKANEWLLKKFVRKKV
ncbi:hypothetical protein X560_0407 [Listeria fleischmannii 1991]|uniref:Uncharacterized protein n=2 Tax=Listeria fleischmannii TaxID=1069827 RepID=A0A2X3H481_9LIST|nr:hypothetical protein [Listeria fleischmannii]EMG27509.1 hypothetical protein LFLEISCH_10739 [Listeria fleischmannii subsp. fleischmannii LU2006-1]KMT60987.1 hypothetical protein X560_0407 [Listeria fleischmannii 1991]SQC67341.1 Uncharacterised protein [Listeria fleischmannii subsp. fleischmannii]